MVWLKTNNESKWE